jgi:hypothetical protein
VGKFRSRIFAVLRLCRTRRPVSSNENQDHRRPSLHRGGGLWWWTTRTDEVVFHGDLVVLSLPNHPAVVGRIINRSSSGLIHCVLMHGPRVLPGEPVEVEEAQLLAKVAEDQLRAAMYW